MGLMIKEATTKEYKLNTLKYLSLYLYLLNGIEYTEDRHELEYTLNTTNEKSKKYQKNRMNFLFLFVII